MNYNVIVRILAAIQASQANYVFNCALVDEQVLHCSKEERNRIATQLQEDGYIKGLIIFDEFSNLEYPLVMWEQSKPELTLKGIEYISTNEPIKKVMAEIKDISIAVASQTIANTINNML